jgi:hypothetical protein
MALREKLHIAFSAKAGPGSFQLPRRYTLTHSDITGELFLTIGGDYDRRQISGWYTRLMRDEVLAEWLKDNNGFALHVYCHVSGGLVFGSAGWRFAIFHQHLPLVIQAVHEGDREIIETHPGLAESEVIVHFHASQARYKKIETWGPISGY